MSAQDIRTFADQILRYAPPCWRWTIQRFGDEATAAKEAAIGYVGQLECAAERTASSSHRPACDGGCYEKEET